MWAAVELHHLDLGDQRLNQRSVWLIDALLARPEVSVPQATGDWASTKAAYRFWDNDRVDPEALRDAARQRTLERLPEDELILALQDSTDLEDTHHPCTKDLGYLAHPAHLGLWLHSTLAVDTRGVPLGLLDQRCWTRDPDELGKRAKRRVKETEQKESQRWLEALAATEAAVPEDRTVVTIADREADFYDLFAAPRRPNTHLLIRAKPRRRVRRPERLLGPAVRATAPLSTLEVELPRGDNRPSRTANLTLRATTVEIQPPATHPRRAALPDLRLTAVLAEEENPPAGVTPVRWWLTTTLRVDQAADAERLVRWYALRWLIERYHFVLKSGCKVEQLQLETAARLERAVALYAIVAWCLLWLTYEARRRPDQPCEAVLPREQWQVLYQAVHRVSAVPRQPPSLREAVRLIARLGGFLARRYDGDPGVKTIWRGLRRLEDLVAGWQLARSSRDPPEVVGNA